MKARFMTDFEKQNLLKNRKPLPQAKPSAPFQIPNEYLPLDRRTVKQGKDGTEERLRRDRIRAKRTLKPRRFDSIGDEATAMQQLNHDNSVATLQGNRMNSSLEVGHQRVQYQSQRDLDSSFDVNTSLNHSTSLGRILFGKDEIAQRNLANKVKLPSIHKKNLKNFEKGLARMSASSAQANSIESTKRAT